MSDAQADFLADALATIEAHLFDALSMSDPVKMDGPNKSGHDGVKMD